MSRRPSRSFWSYVAVGLVAASVPSLLVAPASAEDKKIEKEAKDLQNKAINEDNLMTNYPAAIQKLEQAVQKCGADKCTPRTKAEVTRDLGAMQILAGKVDEGKASFVEALKVDPTLALDAAYKTPMLEALWTDAKKKVPGAPTAPASTPTTPTTRPTTSATGPTPPPSSDEQPRGDFIHTVWPVQQHLTPLPVFVEYPGSETLTRVIVKYKSFGMTDFKTLELSKMGKGWGGMIPCKDVTQGEFKYYLQGYAGDENIATSGDRNRPFHMKVTREAVDGEAPSLPGVNPPKQCREEGDCPPDFPGCKSKPETSSLKDEGESCEEGNECKSGTCKKEKCTAPEDGKKFKRLWLGLGGQLNFAFVGSADNVCKLDPKTATPLNTIGFYCTDADGNDYPSRTSRTQNDAIVMDRFDQVKGGGALGNFRILASFDYAINANFLLGARVGFVVPSYPGQAAKDEGKTFAPVHLEARATYLFGKEALSNAGIAPYVMGGLGASQFDAKVPVSVQEGSNTRSVDAWMISGPLFFALGAGVRYAFSPNAALLGGIHFNGALGTAFIPVLAPEISAQFGL